MKILTSVFLFLWSLSLLAAEVKPGDDVASMRANLGLPRGQVHVGDREVFYYDRGEVEARSGVVTHVTLRSEEAQTVLEAKRAADARRSREEQLISMARLNAEGEALKARKLSDAAFQATPLKYQVAFWEDFSRRYATVPCLEQLTGARSRLAAQIKAEQAHAAHLAELEARAAEAEARAAEANARAERDRDYYSSYRRGYDFYPSLSGSHHRSRNSTRNHNAVVICRTDVPPTTPSRPDNRSGTSGLTAEVFSGKDWLVWPSPAR